VAPSLSFSIFFQILGLLCSKSWETRVAAAEALGAIAEKVPWPSVAQLQAQALRTSRTETGCTHWGRVQHG